MTEKKEARICAWVTPTEKEAFVAMCAEKSINASEILRKMIRDWVTENKEGK